VLSPSGGAGALTADALSARGWTLPPIPDELIAAVRPFTGAPHLGNPLDVTGDTVFSSSVATDVVSGNRIGFPTASPHVITATYGPSGATASITVEVKAMLPPTGADSAATAALAALALAAGLALLAGAARFRRRTR